MLKQKHFVLSSLLGVLGVILLLLTFQFGSINRVDAFGGGIIYSKDQSYKPNFNNDVTWITEGNVRKYIYDLFSTTADGVKLPDTFGAQVDSSVSWGTSNKSTYTKSNNSYSYYRDSATNGTPKNGLLTSEFTISSKLKQAMINGALTLQASAYVNSLILSDSDKTDKIQVSFDGQTRGGIETNTPTLVSFYANNIQDSYTFTFQVDHNGAKKEVIFGIEVDVFTETNMVIQNPTLTFETTDILAPSVRITPEGFAKSKTLEIKDAGAGIDIEKLVVTIDGVVVPTDQMTVSADTRTVTIPLNTNKQQISVEAYDNVGNLLSTSLIVDGIDNLAPAVSTLVVEPEDNVYSKSKDVTVEFYDANDNINAVSGIASIKLNGTDVTTPEILSAGQFTFTVNTTDEYTVEVIDNLGNSTIYRYSTQYLDNSAPIISLDINDGQVFNTKNIEANLILDSTVQADENYYYTVDRADSETMGDPTDDSENNTRKALSLGANIISVPDEGEYIIKIFGRDVLGNAGEVISYRVTVSLLSYSISYSFGGETYVGKNSAGEVIEHQVETQVVYNGITYQLYKATRIDASGVRTDIGTSQSDFVMLDENTAFELTYREVVEIDILQNKYEYSGDALQIEYTTIVRSLDTEYPNEDIFVKYSQNGIEVTPIEAGIYDVNILIDNDTYTLNYDTTMRIFKPLNFDIKKNYVYNTETFELNFSIDADIQYTLVLSDADGQEIDLSLAKRESLDAGTYTYTFTILDENYYLNGEPVGTQSITDTLVIEDMPVVLPEFSETILYNGTQYSVDSIYGGYTVYVEFLQNGEKAIPQNAGEYQVSIKVNQKNYTGSTLGTLIIQKRTIKITADAKSSEYGADLQELTYRVSGDGFVSGEEYVFTPKCDFDASADRVNAGEYVISFETIEEESLQNYEVTFVNSVYTVSQRSVIVKVKSGQSKVYGDIDPELEYEVEGVLPGDDLGLTLQRVESEDVGNYAITIKECLNDNYAVDFRGENFKITQRRLIISANAVEKSYDGTTNLPEGLAQNYDIVSGSIADRDRETFSFALTASPSANVGKYLISPVTLDIPNYEIIYMSNYLYILPREVTVSANEAVKEFGQNDPVFTYTVDGEIVEGDTFTGALSRVAGENIGKYAITLGTLYNKNYTINFVSNTLAITKASIEITIQDATKIYGVSGDPKFKWTTSEQVNKDLINASLSREQGEDVGEYTISGTFTSDFYEITVVDDGTMTITPATAYLTLTNQTKTFGKLQDPTYRYNLRGVLPIDLDEVTESIVITREAGENVGEYAMSATCSHDNYNFVIGGAIFSIVKANIEIILPNSTFVYDGTAKTPTATLNFNGKSQQGTITYRITQDGETVAEALNAGTYRVEASFAGDDNFLGASASANLTITKKDIAITIFKDIFVMKKDGSIQEPEIDCALEKSEYQILFDEADAGNVGVHEYSIVFNNPNYNSIRGSVQILPIPTNTTEGGSVEFVDGSVNNDDVQIVIQNTNDKNNAENATSMVVDKTYEIKYNQDSDAQLKVELDYAVDDYSNVFVYVYNDEGEARMVLYDVIDGKIVLNMDAENVKLAIVRKVAGISIATVALIAGICILIAYSYVRRRKKKKMRRILSIA